MKKLTYIDKYNRPGTVAVISLYPKKGEIYSSGASGVASYTKNVVRHMKQPVVVLADKCGREKRYEEDGSLVLRVWERNHKRMWLQLLGYLRRLSQVSSLLIHFDFSMYGGMVTSGLMLPFLAITRLMGFKPVVVSHHVIVDVRKLSGQVGLGVGIVDAMKALIYNVVFKVFYQVLGLVAEKVIVLEEPLKARLDSVMPGKVAVIPHAVDEELVVPTKTAARKRLGYAKDEAVILFFGYVNWFKGADIFAKSFARVKTLVGKKARFVMAGGESATLKDKTYYQDFFDGVEQTVRQAEAMELTGYVPQGQIADYFAAADVVVFPYREFMCASGVLAQAFAYGKPVVVSQALARMFEGKEMSEALAKVDLRLADITFDLNRRNMLEVLERVVENGIKAKAKRLAGVMCRERSFTKTAYRYEKVMAYEPKTQDVPADSGAWAYVVDK